MCRLIWGNFKKIKYEVFGLCFFKYLFCPPLFHLSFYDSNYIYVRTLDIVLYGSKTLRFPSILFLSAIHNHYSDILIFLFCHLKLAVENSQWIFYFYYWLFNSRITIWFILSSLKFPMYWVIAIIFCLILWTYF